MTSISPTFTPHRTRARRSASRHVWRDIGIGLTVSAIVVAAMALERHGNSEIQMGHASPGFEEPRSTGGWEHSVPLDMLPLGTLAADVTQ
jgi:hypothetical protein